MLYAVLEHSYAEEMVEGEVRKVLRLPPWIAPVQVAVFPLMPRDGLEILAREIADSLTSSGLLVEYDENGAIGRRYRRQDEVGTPYAVTVDYETKENHTVTIRDRDSMQQIRVPVLGLEEFIRSLVSGATALEF
jgi:glycyl-tRNA synthetase